MPEGTAVSFGRTSVVIPTKNDIAHIDRCLSSLLPYFKAGYINEIIIIDGHSTDGTLDVLKKYPVKLVFEKGKGTINIAFDYGWRQAQSEIIMLMNSDVYLGDGFFPQAYELLSDEKVGWISCVEKAVISNGISRSQAETWASSDVGLSSSSNWFQELYSRMAGSGGKKILYGGPCMITRRTCLEEINGLLGITLGTLEVCGDICFSQRIQQRGWKAVWWLEAPSYHHPVADFQRLMKQFRNYGKSQAYAHLEPEFNKDYPWYGKVIGILSRLASPFIGIAFAIRFRNPRQLYIYPLPRFAWVWGYIKGWLEAKKPNQPVYSEPGILPTA